MSQSGLTTTELYHLNEACALIAIAFDAVPYLVGSAEQSNARPRDVDVRLILGAEEFAAACPTQARWEALCLAFSTYLRERTGLPIDFQIQRRDEANAKYGSEPRNPLGALRSFAGGGDATPDWSVVR